MAIAPIQLHEVKHPDRAAQARYDRLVGIDDQKTELLEYLLRVLDPTTFTRWLKTHHPKGLPIAAGIEDRTPLVILAGEVGCGKTALATSIGSPLATRLDKRVAVLETPSDIRGGGLVGQLSERVTAAFQEARVKVGKGQGILIIDEGDDLGTSRAQMQAHHEDRAGLNVLIKEIDRLAREHLHIAVLLITNRLQALDPALIRRGHVIRFRRPDAGARRVLFERLLDGIEYGDKDIEALVTISEREPLLSYSDIVERGAEVALLKALRADKPFSTLFLREALECLQPSPMIEEE